MSLPDLPGEPIVHGRTLHDGFEVSCDVVVVGSGAGGATVASHLAEAGLKVLILEEGPYIRRDDYQKFAPTESIRRMFREGGLLAAIGIGQTPLISLTVGRAVGGSSLLTGGVCFRVPEDIHHQWDTELHLKEYSEAALEAEYADVEKRLHVKPVPEELRSESTRKFVDGAKTMGIEMSPISRNTGDDCEGNARCNFGCPAGAKRAVDIAYLPSAYEHGARLVSDALVEKVTNKDGRASGVEGRVLGGPGGAPSARFKVHAKRVVVACGTIHTPMLLSRSGVKHAALGRHITLHPAARMCAIFDDKLNGWDGALQSCYSDRYDHEGIKLTGVYSTVNILAAGFPGVGPELRRRVAEMPHVGVFGCMVHDEGGGVVRRSVGREPNLTYEMSKRDLARLRRGIRILADIAFAGGAKEVIPPIFGIEPITNPRDTKRLEEDPLDARRIESMAFHPLGSARMAVDDRGGIVDQNGESFALPGLFIADGSILPTSIGVNSQQPIMAVATRIAWRMRSSAGA